ncbi:6-carboxytetrahydropterin synthase QueD [Myxococcus sp. CA051A]|uniref:6-carboxy-5,6,7,8-tetrahydropterin synthase n=1 Tax=Myxococcus llanfairpwllgwyngyllgogerychwyrndrobwllllantysiliogogogochensis TaxID=2590453 RepID=A0A540WYM0_9BACT|nr:6-carboxytetrahydropterin synthase QueD [Myxococcus sp. CA040A]NTX12020.1 6-carboxytetrahydropterin synthase QueD [Myxococcus sp. CA056]NTX33037.1 6-carboxytetrahydropterin synthase QueD [Myxococcus sp. CA033]NTX54164.1 6-carboxytetrahydropterin synthase QueD [Myxococcus sp. CA039A]NTX59899.1 6-carboxytetrahydropterin synthase QueD [Myxococcus sp. CA051A]TQF14102.1 6-carboxytetrahydropterin synthase QueD [Myxococcus llanfairpwllgwyngyllgogerychwyrndrobwllllantysiliogogogochensis]
MEPVSTKKASLVTEISKEFTFEAAHRLPNVPPGHKCSRVHGHSYRIEITVRGPVDPHFGWIVDFAELNAAWQPLHALLDHRLLNDVPGLENPTSELLAAWVFERLSFATARVVKLRVSETCTSQCTVYPAEG